MTVDDVLVEIEKCAHIGDHGIMPMGHGRILRDEIHRLRTALAEAQGDRNTLAREIITRQVREDDLRSRLSAVQEQNLQLVVMIGDRNTELADLRARLSAAEAALAERKKEIVALRMTLTRHRRAARRHFSRAGCVKPVHAVHGN